MTTNLSTQIRPGTYTIDPDRSTCRLIATHVFGLKPVDATMTVHQGTITVADDPARSTASAEIATASFRSDDAKRNRDIRGKRFLDAVRFPVIAFRSTGFDDGRLTGVLNVRGQDSPVTLELGTAEPTGDGCRFTATCTVDRVAAGVKTGRAIVGRTVHISLDLYCAG
ncbi:YceI family protein [Actinoplanes sp. TBRC 11911]|uniref:YceI family protein n=1 Tax=Actinoplanes sp. TBRC 11911 TaxID=2729386 RepID=UPI00145F3C95|nr:YceI family protein [Actinoplanes sp. TBRC 11911]NMO51280.1 YceI family protein [Actinoplanes sp. TBRC 11911]